jgi:hypothetical protein
VDTKALIRHALEDAIAWERELMRATKGRDHDGYNLAKELHDGYLKILKRRYPPRREPTEGMRLVPVMEIGKTHWKGK